MEQPNKLMTWDEMVKQYPDRWVFVEVTKGDGTNIDEGIVRYVTTDDEMEQVWVKCMDEGLNYEKDRTTVSPYIGPISGFIFETDKEGNPSRILELS